MENENKLPEEVTEETVTVPEEVTEEPVAVPEELTEEVILVPEPEKKKKFPAWKLTVSITAMVLVIAELMDTTINSDEYLTVVYKNYPLLAVIPGAENPKSSYRGYYRGNYAAKPKEKSPEKKSAAKKSDENKDGGAK